MKKPNDTIQKETTIKFCLTNIDEHDWSLPTKQSEDAAGYDLSAYINEPITLKHNDLKVISTGWSVEISKGYVGLICSRSGLAAKHGVFILNSPGIIDSDYRGDVKIILMNLGNEDFIITRGMRIAQILFMPIDNQSETYQVSSLKPTVRDKKGLGSTGV
jgi:dUTP pyrophosphatase